MFKMDKFDETRTAKDYYNDVFFYNQAFNFAVVFSWGLSLFFSAQHFQPNIFNNLQNEIGRFFLMLISVTISFILLGFLCLGFIISWQHKFLTNTRFVFLIIAILLILIGLKTYNFYDTSHDIECYTTNFETYHLYENCYFLKSSDDVYVETCENIYKDKICSFCKWHYETPQTINNPTKK